VKVTARQLNRTTLHRQLLLQRKDLRVPDAIRTVCALQAQSAASPYLALWNRIADFDAAELDRAFADHTVVKASLIRITLHAVATEDYPAFHRTMASSLRASRLYDHRFKATGLSIADVDAVLPQVLEFAGQPRTNAEMEAMLTERVGVLPEPRLWWALRTFAPVLHAPTGGPWSFGDRPSYVASGIEPFDGDEEESRPLLVRRYLEAFGPASEGDIGQFTILRMPAIRAALAVLVGELETHEGLDGKPLYDVRGGELAAADALVPPRLMAMWDSILLAYKDRGRVIPEDYRKLVIRSNGDVLPTLLVDGYVAGVWRPADGGIEATAFHELSDGAWSGLAGEAAALVAFLADRQPDVYRRYARWWETLPYAERRLLSG